MQQRNTAGIFPDIVDGIHAALLRPVNVQFEHHVRSIGVGHHIVVDHLSFALFELFGVIMETETQPAFLGLGAHLVEVIAVEFDVVEFFADRVRSLHGIGAPGLGLRVERLFPPIHHLGVGFFGITAAQMRAHHLHPEVLAHFAEFGGSVTVEFAVAVTGGFEGLVTHFGGFFQRARHVLFHCVAQRVELQADDFVRGLAESSLGQQPASDHGTGGQQHGSLQKFSSVHNWR